MSWTYFLDVVLEKLALRIGAQMQRSDYALVLRAVQAVRVADSSAVMYE